MTVNPTLSSLPSAVSSAKDVASPFAGEIPAEPGAALDRADLSSAVAPPAAQPVESASPRLDGRLAALVAAGLAGAVLVGVAAPVATNLLSPPPTSISQTAVHLAPEQVIQKLDLPATLSDQAAKAEQPGGSQPTQPQDPVTLISTLAVYSEASSQQLPKAAAVQQQWAGDVTAMQDTVNGVYGHVDALMRHPGQDVELHHQAIDEGLARLGTQLGAFQQRIQTEGPVVDQFLGENRANLNQAGTVAFNASQSVDQGAARYGLFTPQRGALRRLSGSFYKASKNLAMATEKTTDTRVEQKVLSQDVQTVQKFLAQVQQANQKSRTDASAMATVDQGTQVLKQALAVTRGLLTQQEKDVQAGSQQAHLGATHLVDALQQLVPMTGHGQQTEAPAAK